MTVKVKSYGLFSFVWLREIGKTVIHSKQYQLTTNLIYNGKQN